MEPSKLISDIIGKVEKAKMLGLSMVMERVAEFPSMVNAKLAGIALESEARQIANTEIDKAFANNARVPAGASELVIGGGFHAATYVANRVLAGFPAPIVFERNEYVGGAFAVPAMQRNTYDPVFFLNSRNRRGNPGLSGDTEAQLNYLPGAPLQAAALSNAEYQTNADMAFIIRLTLAQYASKTLFTNRVVTRVQRRPDQESFNVTYDGPNGAGAVMRVSRIIDARGLGDSRDAKVANGNSIVTFPQFMQRMTNPWPLRGLRNVAVIGAGDSARCTVESLLGIGPNQFMGAAQLDTVNRITWYGQVPDSVEGWCNSERGRYRRIGGYLRKDQYGIAKLNVERIRNAYPIALPEGPVLINGQSYDLVVMATGNEVERISGLNGLAGEDYPYITPNDAISSSTFTVASKFYSDRNANARYRIGPCAELPFTDTEFDSGISQIANNRVAMFRLAPKTAALAVSLPDAIIPAPDFKGFDGTF